MKVPKVSFLGLAKGSALKFIPFRILYFFSTYIGRTLLVDDIILKTLIIKHHTLFCNPVGYNRRVLMHET